MFGVYFKVMVSKTQAKDLIEEVTLLTQMACSMILPEFQLPQKY